MTPHPFMPRADDGSICAYPGCAAGADDPVHTTSDATSPRAEDQLEWGRRLAAEARAKRTS